MSLPSGENFGCASKARPFVILFAFPPLIGIVYISPKRSKAIVFPSGLTSTDIHVPSSVLSLIIRSGFKGKRAFFFFNESFFSILFFSSGS